VTNKTFVYMVSWTWQTATGRSLESILITGYWQWGSVSFQYTS